jgi:hypothetical protein
MKIMNKKAQVGEAIQELIGILSVSVILLFFFLSAFMFGIPGFKPEKITNDVNEQVQDYYFVLTELNKEVNFDYEKIHEINGFELCKISGISEEAKLLLKTQGLDIEQLEGIYVSTFDEKIYVSKLEE